MENIYKINKTLFENIRDKGFTSFTDVQKNVIKKNNYNRDLLVSSKTGFLKKYSGCLKTQN